MPLENHLEIAQMAMEHEDWMEAERQFGIISREASNDLMGQEALYHLGVACYNQQEYDNANAAFSEFIKQYGEARYFEAAVQYKYIMACELSNGARHRPLGAAQLPKWASGWSMALELFDEVIATLPCHDLAAKSVFAKASMKWEEGSYAESVDVFQQLIKRFPKHELVPESYLSISTLYLLQSMRDMQNFDLLALAQINLRKFETDFPREPRLAWAQEDVMAIQELHARHLYSTGKFYERKGHPCASLLYYQRAIELFPDTITAELCLNRIRFLGC